MTDMKVYEVTMNDGTVATMQLSDEEAQRYGDAAKLTDAAAPADAALPTGPADPTATEDAALVTSDTPADETTTETKAQTPANKSRTTRAK